MTQGNLGEFHHSNIPGSFLVDSWDSQELVGECKELLFSLRCFLSTSSSSLSAISTRDPPCEQWLAGLGAGAGSFSWSAPCGCHLGAVLVMVVVD